MTTVAQSSLSRNGKQALDYAKKGRKVAPAWWVNPDGTCACGNTESHGAGSTC